MAHYGLWFFGLVVAAEILALATPAVCSTLQLSSLPAVAQGRLLALAELPARTVRLVAYIILILGIWRAGRSH